MIKKKYLATVCLIFSLAVTFLAILINTVGSQPLIPYDPWYDLNDDGAINILDMKLVKLAFGSSGTPINKTALLLELNASVAELEARVGAIEVANSLGFTSPPAYDSGWIAIAKDQNREFNHTLGTTKVLVYVMGKKPPSDIHQLGYGGIYLWNLGGDLYFGVYWFDLTDNSVWVHRNKDDGSWDSVRVMIWMIP